MAAADGMTIEQWTDKYANSIADLKTHYKPDLHYSESAKRLRQLLQLGLLRQTDIRDCPERFFMAHRQLSKYATQLGPGFGIRFTVQFNLFAGTIIGLGGPQQLADLDRMQENGRLGCFALTERLAGVNSGLVVNTTCTWDPKTETFDLHCPNEDAYKNWISQGLTADMAVAVATLMIGGKSYGPHAFVMDFRKDGKLVDGVTIGDMGGKTIGNDLDNAWIKFDHVKLPKTALLNKYSDIDGDSYVQKVKGVKAFEMIGQRLYTGRAVIAQSTLVFTRSLFDQTKAYSDSKKCWNPKGTNALSNIPQLEALYVEADSRLRRLELLIHKIENALSQCLSAGTLPSVDLIDTVATAKVKCIETTIELCFRLKNEVGSYALMAGTGFERLDYLNCCKFAEGDSRILMQKMARDRMQAFKKKQDGAEAEVECCMQLGGALMSSKDPMKAWNESWETVYKLAELVMQRHMDAWVPLSKM